MVSNRHHPNAKSGTSHSQQFVVALCIVALIMLLLARTQNVDVMFDRVSVKDNPHQLLNKSSVSPDRTTNDRPDFFESDEESTSSSSSNPIRQISILGERNSGTRWTWDHVSECFNHSLIVIKELTRYKHWFQYDDPSRYPHDTLVLAQFRNPYDWLMAMQHVPHHSPAHLGWATNHSWETFLTKPWTMDRIGTDLWLNRTNAPTKTLCQQDFLYRDIISCDIEPLPHEYYTHTIRYSEHQPFYEMRNDGSGEPYANLMELRSDKIRNFLSVSSYDGVADVWVLQYEYLVHKGTQHLIDRIAEWTGVEPHCTAKPPQVRIPKKSRIVPVDMAKHIRENLNWTVERWIGYEPDPMREEIQWDW